MTLSSPPSSPRSRRPMRRPSPSPLRLVTITESPEYEERVGLNLGAESPGSILKPAVEDHEDVGTGVESKSGLEDEWRKSGIAVHTDVPMRSRSWRSASFSEKRKSQRRPVVKDLFDDMDCGICFEMAVSPCRMVCCGNVFCLNHISDWLYGSSSDGRCPSCKERCSLVQEISSTHPADGKCIDHVKKSSSTQERSVILLLLQPSESKSKCPPVPSLPIITRNSGSRTDDSQKPVAIRTDADSPPPDSHVLGSCRFHLNSTLMVLVGRMLGRVLSVVGLTLFLFVLLT